MEDRYWDCKACSARFEHGAAIQYRVSFVQGPDRSVRLHHVEYFDPALGGVQIVRHANLRVPDLPQGRGELLAQGVIGPVWYCEPCFNRLFSAV